MPKICPDLSGVDLDGNSVKIECIEHQCSRYIQVQGQHPQTGELISEFDCANNWNVVIAMDNARRLIGVQSATESFRNEMVDSNKASLALASNTIKLQEIG